MRGGLSLRAGSGALRCGDTCTCCPPFAVELLAYRQARANVATRPLNIVMYGNSIMQGLGVTNHTDGWVAKLGDLLTARYGPNDVHGEGFHELVTGVGPNGWTFTNGSGSASVSTNRGHGFFDATLVTTADSVAKTFPFTHLTVEYLEFNTVFGFVPAGEFEVEVDSVVVATINPRNLALPDAEFHHKYAGPIYSDGIGGSVPFTDEDHDVVIRPTGAGLQATLLGGSFAHHDNADAGFRLWNGGHATFWTSVLRDRPNPDKWQIIEETSSPLVIIAHQFNDRTATAAQYADRMEGVADQLRAVVDLNSTSVVWASEHRYTDPVGDEDRWFEQRYEIAARCATEGWAYFDVGGYIAAGGDYSANGHDPCMFLSDGTHPSDGGHTTMAAIYYHLLTDQPLATVPTWTCP